MKRLQKRGSGVRRAGALGIAATLLTTVLVTFNRCLGRMDEVHAVLDAAGSRQTALLGLSRKLKPEEYQGGTTAVSNLGMYGINHFTAVINPPHATILAVGTSEERPVVRDGKIEIAQMMSVTLSCDHRAIDGALGAELIGAFKQLIENPVMMMV